jgi:hypothetical protein
MRTAGRCKPRSGKRDARSQAVGSQSRSDDKQDDSDIRYAPTRQLDGARPPYMIQLSEKEPHPAAPLVPAPSPIEPSEHSGVCPRTLSVILVR